MLSWAADVVRSKNCLVWSEGVYFAVEKNRYFGPEQNSQSRNSTALTPAGTAS